MARIVVVGGGYVGLCTAVAFAEHGHNVEVVDVVPEKVDQIRAGVAPFYEPGLEEALKRGVAAGRLTATTDLRGAVSRGAFTFLCVGTPQGPDGAQDLTYMRRACEEVGAALRESSGRHVVITKSTVMPGTARDIVIPTLEGASGKKVGEGFGVGSNPEFLKEGAALKDALNPDRIVVGATDDATRAAIWSLYTAFDAPHVDVDCTSAEMIKYAANAFLAVKISYANEMANLCSRIGVDWYDVVEGIGPDPRIGKLFLRPGAGYGGSCFPKDVAALHWLTCEKGVPSKLLDATQRVNEAQPLEVLRMLREELGELRGKRVALLGLAFKADTDDVRETRALPIYRALLVEGADVVCHDPQAGPNFAKLVGSGVKLAASAEEALTGADACVVQTEWEEYRLLDARSFERLRTPIVVDARRTLRADLPRAHYRAIGLGRAPQRGESAGRRV